MYITKQYFKFYNNIYLQWHVLIMFTLSLMLSNSMYISKHTRTIHGARVLGRHWKKVGCSQHTFCLPNRVI